MEYFLYFEDNSMTYYEGYEKLEYAKIYAKEAVENGYHGVRILSKEEYFEENALLYDKE